MTDREIEIEQVEPADGDILEEWVRVTVETDLLGAEATRSPDQDWPWQVSVSVMEFVRVQPLEAELSAAVASALADVPGVEEVHREDRETWVVRGQPNGPALVRAVARVVDRFAPTNRAVLDGLQHGSSATSAAASRVASPPRSRLLRGVWFGWWAGTILIVLSWSDVVPRNVGWAGFGIAVAASAISVIVARGWRVPRASV